MTWTPRRRTLIRIGVASAAVGLAGCSGGGSDETDNQEDDGGDETSAADTGTATTTAQPPTETDSETPMNPDSTPERRTEVQRTPYQNPGKAIDQWLTNTSNYSGNIEDHRAEDETTVLVGADGNGGTYAFDPPAIRIQTGDTVVWQWQSGSGSHNVAEKYGAFRSGETRSGGGINYQHTFEDTGLYLYECETHTNFGMRGAVLVEEPQTLSGYPRVDNWLEDYEYSGRLSDHRGEQSLEITVGAEGPEGPYAFRPIAPLVSQGTQINFNWTGRGGNHTVQWEETPVEVPDSPTTSSARGSWSITLDTPGVYLYRCKDHRVFGGHGAIVVYDG